MYHAKGQRSTANWFTEALAKSIAGPRLAFKGGTALKLFYGLPRFSEDIDYDCLPGITGQDLMDIIMTQ